MVRLLRASTHLYHTTWLVGIRMRMFRVKPLPGPACAYTKTMALLTSHEASKGEGRLRDLFKQRLPKLRRWGCQGCHPQLSRWVVLL